MAQIMTVISWCTYPVVYLFPMLGISASHSVVAIQIGYCCSDIISKCGVGLLIYQITYAKSNKEGLLP
jgi:bacteriorhodopsin